MAKIELKSCKKGYTYDQDKVISPEETVKRALERINGYGVPLIKSFYRVDTYVQMPQYRIDVTSYVQNHSTNKEQLLKGTNGKGAADGQSRASCVMEFVERFSINSYNKWKKSRYVDFREGEAVSADAIATTLNYDWRADPDCLMDKLKNVPMEWAEAYNFSTGRDVYIPKLFLNACSTGLSAGNTLEEALLQAICECVERHCGAIIQWYKQEYPTIDKSSIKSQVNLDLINKIESRGMEVIIKDFSGILGIPTIGVVLLDKEYRDDIGQSIGVCCSKEKALVRALTESMQGVQKRTSGMLKNRTGSYFFDNYEDVKFLLTGKKMDFEDVIDLSEDDIKKEAEKCIGILERRGMEVICVNTEESKLGIPACWTYLKNAYLVYSVKPFALYLAKSYLMEKEWQEAVSCLEKLKGRKGSDNDLYFYTALAHKGKGEYSEAIKNFEKALGMLDMKERPEKKDDKGDTYLYIGMCYFELKDYDRAIEYFEKSREIDAGKDTVYYNLGIAHQCKKEYTKALENFDRVLEINPDFPDSKDIYTVMGWCLMELGKFDKAIEKFMLAAVGSGDMGQIFFGLGLCHKNIENYSEAIRYFEKMSAAGKDRAEEEAAILFHTGECYEAMKDYESAIKHYGKAGDIKKDDFKIFFKLGVCRQCAGLFAEAVADYERALEKGASDNAELYLRIGMCRGMLGEHEKALDMLERAAEEQPDKDKSRIIKYNIGLEYQALGNFPDAQKQFEKALAGCGDDMFRGEIKYQIAYCKVNMAESMGVRELLAEAIKDNPDKPEAYNLLGSLYLEDKNYDAAISTLKEGIRRQPGHWENYNLLGVCYRNKGDTPKAVEMIEEAIRLSPKEWRNHNILGRILIGTGEIARAKESLKKAVEYCDDKEYRSKIEQVLAAA